MNEVLAAIERRLDECMLADAQQLRRNLKKQGRKGKPDAIARMEKRIERSAARVRQRRARIPELHYPAELPVTERREDLAEAIRDHQVVIVAGETGSGKTTQIPKICLELGRGVRGMIGHTQPRRVAARSTAARLAEETQSELGDRVGYRVRFTDRVGQDTLVKLVTDGMLLAETQSDRDLLAYDTIIIDEAHERSLNIDFLLGYLRRLLQRRPDLKLIITSATLDTERFAKHFGKAPVIEVSGRTWPVEVRYRPLEEAGKDSEKALPQGIGAAARELWREGPGDILVFLPGEREIRDAEQHLRKRFAQGVEILPLFGRLSSRDQDRVFHPDGSKQRIVLATNVAETSLTVPGIRYVIDSGLVRLSRYSYRTKVQRLPIEPVARASAEQRAGRCGRLGPGICIRLYGEEDFEARPEYTEPEIQRSNLASVILQMKSLGLGDPEDFPFVDPPESGLIRDGYRVLEELGALDGEGRLTQIGRQLARLPVDPRLARMLVEADRRGSLAEVLVIVAGLSIQDPRERPENAREKADECHRQDLDERSDFLALFNLWQRYREQTRELSRNQRRKWARRQFLAPMRMEEWGDLLRQLRLNVRDLKFSVNPRPADYAAVHRALLAGLVTRVGRKEEKHSYQGPRGLQFQIFPGSGLFKRSPKWVMAGELVQTSRTFARSVARVEAEWIEAAAEHLVSREYHEPHWQPRKGRVAAFEKVTLFGLELVARRRVDFGRVAPEEARSIFLREGLLHGDLPASPEFVEHNLRLVEEVREQEAKRRRQDLLRDEEDRIAFYDQRVPDWIRDWPSLRKWLKEQGTEGERRLRMDSGDVMTRDPGELEEDFPDHVRLGGVPVPVEYRLDPGGERDGATVEIPLALINQIRPADLDWIIPGWREEKATALIRSLPKSYRRRFVPAPDFARAALEAMEPGPPMTAALAQQLKRMTGTAVPEEAWRPEQIPEHLRVRVRLIDPDGETVDEHSDVAALQAKHGHRASEAVGDAVSEEWPNRETRKWDFGEIPESVEVERFGVRMRAWPALRDTGRAVELVLQDHPDEARAMTHEGIRRLVSLRLSQQVESLRRNPRLGELALKFRKLGTDQALRDALTRLAIDEAVLGTRAELPRNGQDFEARCRDGAARLIDTGEDWLETLGKILDTHHRIRKRLSGGLNPVLLKAAKEIGEQLDYLLFPGFLEQVPTDRLRAYPRYLRAIEIRLDKLEQGNPDDARHAALVRPYWERVRDRIGEPGGETGAHELERYRWMVEEYRVSVFAQQLGTEGTVSPKRLDEQWAKVPG